MKMQDNYSKGTQSYFDAVIVSKRYLNLFTLFWNENYTLID